MLCDNLKAISDVKILDNYDKERIFNLVNLQDKKALADKNNLQREVDGKERQIRDNTSFITIRQAEVER